MRRVHRAALPVFLFALACGPASSFIAPKATPSLTISPGMISVIAGGAPISFHATLANGPGPIVWTLDGLGALSATTGDTVDYTPPHSARDPVTATVRVAAGDLQASASVAIAPAPPSTVSGRCIDLDGGPVANVKILVVGHPAVTTDANGQFSVEQVEMPFTLAFEDPSATVKVFASLSKKDLLIRLAHNAGNAKSVAIRGVVRGGAGYPAADTSKTTVLFRPEGAATTCSAQTDKQGKYSLSCRTLPNARATGTLYAVQYTFDQTGPLAFTGYGLRPVEVDPNQTLTGQDIAVAAPDSNPIHLAAYLPEGWKATGRGWRMQMLDGATFTDYATQLLAEGWPEAGIDLVTPQIPGARLMFDLNARADPAATTAWLVGSTTRAVDPGTAAVDLAVPRPLALVSPAAAATDVGHAPLQFAWEPAQGLKQLSLAIAPGGGKLVLLHTEAETTEALPDLIELGVTILPTVEYRWSVTRLSVGSVDDFFGAVPAQDAADASSATSDAGTFTTAP